MELIQPSETLELVHAHGNWSISQDSGFSPVQLIAASAAACSTYVFEKLLDERGIPYELKKVLFDYQLGVYYPNPVTRVDVQFFIKANARVRNEIEHVFYQIAENCPVIQSLHPRIKINESIIFD
ncbi:OsmC family protein [Sporolactobacillus shoreicorticis]|uniref:OsmC family protein n=1 Tax=Sporolactobacillus shoreicorticis TaxID=1923877 RepID=A0ABW5S4J4_9BACL|nr:OsmC family protein [Sporolactobacillus shoreicorticis]MCO7124325.1 OsmC family protein [Sporolactobacillus shoreicorticis]